MRSHGVAEIHARKQPQARTAIPVRFSQASSGCWHNECVCGQEISIYPRAQERSKPVGQSCYASIIDVPIWRPCHHSAKRWHSSGCRALAMQRYSGWEHHDQTKSQKNYLGCFPRGHPTAFRVDGVGCRSRLGDGERTGVCRRRQRR